MRPVAQCRVRLRRVVQPTYETPIKLLFENQCTAGIRGTGNGRWFTARHAERAVFFCSACAITSGTSYPGDSCLMPSSAHMVD